MNNDTPYCDLTSLQINAALADFCCTPLTEEQNTRFEEKSDFGKMARSRSFANDYFRSLDFTDSLDAMASVREKMNIDQRWCFIIELEKIVTLGLDSFHERTCFLCTNADAATQARAAVKALGLGKESS